MRLPFGEFNPDQPGILGGNIMKNVVPFLQSFGPIRDVQSFTGALTSAALEASWFNDDNGNLYNHAGTETTLEQLNPTDNTWANVSKAGNYTGAENWEWAQLGDRIVAVDINNPTQYFDLGASALYADLPGSPPRAKHIAMIRNFMVMGNVQQAGIDYPSRLVWSGYDNTEVWTPSRATQSDQRDLRGDWGAIQRIIPGQVGVIFQRNATSIMRYVGPSPIFNIDQIDRDLGTPAPKSVVYRGPAILFLSDDGFFRFSPSGSTPIGAERIDRWFFSEIADSTIPTVTGAVDPKNHLAIWAFKSSSSLTFNDRLLVYNWSADKWGYGEVNTQELVSYVTQGTTLEGLNSISLSLDALPSSLDSAEWEGGNLFLGAFNTDNELCTFSGDTRPAELTTPEFGEGERSDLRIRPLVNAFGAKPNVTVTHVARDKQDDPLEFSSPKPVNASGVVNFRDNRRFHRVKVNINGLFNLAIGVDVDVIKNGMR